MRDSSSDDVRVRVRVWVKTGVGVRAGVRVAVMVRAGVRAGVRVPVRVGVLVGVGVRIRVGVHMTRRHGGRFVHQRDRTRCGSPHTEPRGDHLVLVREKLGLA